MPPAPAHGVTPPASEPGAATPAAAARERRRPLLPALLALALLAHLVVLYLPGDDVPSAGFEVPGLDKLIHVGVFALPTALILAVRLHPAWLLALAAHAPVSEVLQLTVVPHRSGDPWDVLADLAGVLLGAGLAARARRRAARGGLEVPAGQEYASTVPSRRGHGLGL